jgi:hypothetical protein
LRSGRGVSGGGSSKECGHFSYDVDAMRQSRKK